MSSLLLLNRCRYRYKSTLTFYWMLMTTRLNHKQTLARACSSSFHNNNDNTYSHSGGLPLTPKRLNHFTDNSIARDDLRLTLEKFLQNYEKNPLLLSQVIEKNVNKSLSTITELLNLLSNSNNSNYGSYNSRMVRLLLQLRTNSINSMTTRPYPSHLQELDKCLQCYLNTILFQKDKNLYVREISLNQTNEHVLVQLAQSETNHPFVSSSTKGYDIENVKDWIQQRLSFGRVYVLYYYDDETPLVFLHTTFKSSIPCRMEEVYANEYSSNTYNKNDKVGTTVVFYSIHLAQRGALGLGLGRVMIERACSILQEEMRVQNFVTLSPIPGFRKWLEGRLVLSTLETKFQREVLLPEEKIQLQKLFSCGIEAVESQLGEVLLNKKRRWYENEGYVLAMKPILMRLCAHYLTLEKHRQKPLDSVTKFHCGNGALIFRLNFLADKSEYGMSRSAGMMVNYVYDLDTVNSNSRLYDGHGGLSISKEIKQLLISSHSKAYSRL